MSSIILALFISADPQLVRLQGVAMLPDGTPAVEATVVGTCWHSPTVKTKTNRDGRFTLESEFAGPANISAITADGKFAGKLYIPAQSVRRRAADSLSLKLTPARRVEVVVRKDGKPAAKVQVAYSADRGPQWTNDLGRTTLSIPSEEVGYVYAWDPIRGVGGASLKNVTGTVELELRPTATKRFKVLDEFDKPVKGLKLSMEIGFVEGGWFSGECFPESFGFTDANGDWAPNWTPASSRYIRGESKDPIWEDEGSGEHKGDSNPPPTYVRRIQRLKGKVLMPLGASPENLLIQAESFGPRSAGTSFGARVRADGSFEIPVVSDHFYTMGIVDEQWTSPLRYEVFCKPGETPKDVTIPVEYATVVEVRVVAGKERKPVANAFVQGGEKASKNWIDSKGEKHSCYTQHRQYAYSDDQGVARLAIGRNEVCFSVSHGEWRQEIEAKPPKSGPFEITFHKPFVDKMRIAGKIVPTPATSGRVELRASAGDAWDGAPLSIPVAPDGSFKLETDKPTVRLLATDRTAKTSAVSSLSMETDSLVMTMIANGAYGGTAKTPDGDPLPGCEVTLFLPRDKPLFGPTVKADANVNTVLAKKRRPLVVN